ncbi:hypothetical protein [Pyrodictium abyssi]|uniref:Uncharacterized protein n=1 Tax=Pyrodictium abyssi TaxID=54256 RepID=A0ABN6ZLY0_9CREN|nr:hypothetical protein PABY_08410 [Pyrodictium abyssi]
MPGRVFEYSTGEPLDPKRLLEMVDAGISPSAVEALTETMEVLDYLAEAENLRIWIRVEKQ